MRQQFSTKTHYVFFPLLRYKIVQNLDQASDMHYSESDICKNVLIQKRNLCYLVNEKTSQVCSCLKLMIYITSEEKKKSAL